MGSSTDADEAMSFVFEELDTVNVDSSRAITVVENLKVIGLAIGEEKFRNNLLPKLVEITGGDGSNQATSTLLAPLCSDEVASKLANVLGDCVELFGDIRSDAHHLLMPLKNLCTYDETDVRDAAVKSINAICGRMAPAAVKEHLVPLFLELARSNHWWAPRVSACGLVHTAYSALKTADDTSRNEIVTEFIGLCKDDSCPMVRSAAASRLGDLLEAMAAHGRHALNITDKAKLQAYLSDPEKVGANLHEVFEKFLDEHSNQDHVIVAAVKSAPAIFKYWQLDSASGLKFQMSASHKSWRVRVAVADCLADVASSTTESKTAQEICEKLMTDAEAEVNHAIGLHSAAVAKCLGSSFADKAILPRLKKLCNTQDCSVRDKLAGVLMDMAAPLGKEIATTRLLKEGLFKELANDDNANVKLVVLKKLQGQPSGTNELSFLDVIGLGKETKETLFEVLRPLAGSPSWRVRHTVMLALPKIAEVLKKSGGDPAAEIDLAFGFKLYFCEENTEAGEKTMMSKYGQLLQALPWALDPIAQIRQEYVAIVPRLAEIFNGDSPKIGGKGGAWLMDRILPVLHYCCTEKSYKDRYHIRIVLLKGIACCAEYLKQEDLEEKLGPGLDMAAEKNENGQHVSNLRLMIAQELSKVVPHCSKDFISTKLIPCLDEIGKAPDDDERHFAKVALEVAEQRLNNDKK